MSNERTMPADPPAGSGPVFVVGAMRSGTTLMRLMLNRSSTLAVPSESHFLADLFRRFDLDAVVDASSVDDVIDILSGNLEWSRDWGSDRKALRARLQAAVPMNLGALIDQVFRLETEPTGKPRWGAKTPAHLFQVSRLRLVLPSARFIGMVRDPRDVFLSIAPREWVGTSSWEVGAYLLRCDRLVNEYHHDGRGDFTAVRYEDLVLDPEPTLRRVCTFLDLEYEPAMRDFHLDAKDNVQQWELDIGTHRKLLRPPDPEDVQRWRREGAKRDIREVEAVTSDAIDWFGYEPSIRKREIVLLRQRARLRHHLHQRLSRSPQSVG